AGIHDFLELQAQRGAGLDGGTQHVTGGDLWNTELLGDELCLSTFTGPGSSQQNYAHLVLLIFFYVNQRIRRSGPTPKNRVRPKIGQKAAQDTQRPASRQAPPGGRKSPLAPWGRAGCARRNRLRLPRSKGLCPPGATLLATLQPVL